MKFVHVLCAPTLVAVDGVRILQREFATIVVIPDRQIRAPVGSIEWGVTTDLHAIGIDGEIRLVIRNHEVVPDPWRNCILDETAFGRTPPAKAKIAAGLNSQKKTAVGVFPLAAPWRLAEHSALIAGLAIRLHPNRKGEWRIAQFKGPSAGFDHRAPVQVKRLAVTDPLLEVLRSQVHGGLLPGRKTEAQRRIIKAEMDFRARLCAGLRRIQADRLCAGNHCHAVGARSRVVGNRQSAAQHPPLRRIEPIGHQIVDVQPVGRCMDRQETDQRLAQQVILQRGLIRQLIARGNQEMVAAGVIPCLHQHSELALVQRRRGHHKLIQPAAEA